LKGNDSLSLFAILGSFAFIVWIMNLIHMQLITAVTMAATTSVDRRMSMEIKKGSPSSSSWLELNGMLKAQLFTIFLRTIFNPWH